MTTDSLLFDILIVLTKMDKNISVLLDHSREALSRREAPETPPPVLPSTTSSLGLRPSWDSAPEWAQWLSLTETGNWYWHEAKPDIAESKIFVTHGRVAAALLKMIPPVGKFCTMYEPRPKEADGVR